MPHAPGTGGKSEWWRRDFYLDVSNPGAANAVVEASRRTRYPHRGAVTWTDYELEIICRVDPTTTAPSAPDLTPNIGWTTFLAPREKGTGLEAMAAGFAPPGKLT